MLHNDTHHTVADVHTYLIASADDRICVLSQMLQGEHGVIVLQRGIPSEARDACADQIH